MPGGESGPDRDIEEGSESLHLTDPDSLRRATGKDSSARVIVRRWYSTLSLRSDVANN